MLTLDDATKLIKKMETFVNQHESVGSFKRFDEFLSPSSHTVDGLSMCQEPCRKTIENFSTEHETFWTNKTHLIANRNEQNPRQGANQSTRRARVCNLQLNNH